PVFLYIVGVPERARRFQAQRLRGRISCRRQGQTANAVIARGIVVLIEVVQEAHVRLLAGRAQTVQVVLGVPEAAVFLRLAAIDGPAEIAGAVYSGGRIGRFDGAGVGKRL